MRTISKCESSGIKTRNVSDLFWFRLYMCSRFRLKLVCSLSRLSHLHHPLCLHLSWSPSINPHLRISPVGVDSSAVPHRQTTLFTSLPELIFISSARLKLPHAKAGTKSDDGKEEAAEGGEKKEEGFISGVNVGS